jgi:uncharacterized protein (TIGR03663 family)
MHHDEAVLAHYFPDQIINTGRYRYDPTNYHGPLYYYVTALAKKLGADQPESLRLPVAIARGATALLPIILWPHLSLSMVWIFGLLLLSSPFFLFFSGTFAIMEGFLDFFLFMTCFGLAKFALDKSKTGITWIIVGSLGMSLTKETYAFFIGSIVISLILCDLFRKKTLGPYLKRLIEIRMHVLFYSVSAFLIYAGVYTEGFTYSEGLLNSFKSYFNWGNTAVQKGGHAKSFAYFWQLLFQYEVPLWSLLAVSLYWVRKSNLSLLFSLISLIHLLFYSLIPYKTPWCLPTIMAPFFLIPIFTIPKVPVPIQKMIYIGFGIIVLIWSAIYGHQFYQKILPHPSPFSYVHTDLSYKKFHQALKILSSDAKARNAKGAILIHQSYWPLPYYFRQFKHVGFYNEKHKLTFRRLLEFKILVLSEKASPVKLKDYKDKFHVMKTFHFINDPIYFMIQKEFFKTLSPEAQLSLDAIK